MNPNQWKWIGTRAGLDQFSHWSKAQQGSGCAPNCFDFHGMILDSKALFEWKAEQKEREFPYVCGSDCRPGHAWRPGARRCLKVVDKECCSNIHGSPCPAPVKVEVL